MKITRTFCVLAVAAFLALALAGMAAAHTPICNCFDNGDGTITCEGGFSDGSSAAGVAMQVKNTQGEVLIEGVMDDFGTFTFERPDKPFIVIFDAGPGHTVEIKGGDIQ
ncbi:MAG: hypothetical protein U9R40_07330 [Synergistota bacterium]|nr:hypothetical protein [Synergistota bacterium]